MGFALSEMRLTSAAFAVGGSIPLRHTAYGDNVSPPFAWHQLPEDTRSLAIVCHDPDAPLVTPDGSNGFAHWVLYNIPVDVASVDEGTTANGFTTGPNQLGKREYFGPQPPAGHGVHSYYFWLLALERSPDLPDGLGFRELLRAVEPDLLGMNRLVGTYQHPA